MSVDVRPPSGSGAAGDQQSLEPPALVLSSGGVTLSELIQRARNATGEERAWLSTLINRALNAISGAADKDRQAALVLEMLDDEALHSLEDEREVPCRAVAVEAVLAIGYPWALQLDPDDVQFLREHPAVARTRLPLARIFSGFAGASALTFLGLSLRALPSSSLRLIFASPAELALVTSLALTGLCALPLVLGRPLLRAARWVMGLASVLGASIVVADALAHRPSLIHLLLLVVPALGLTGTLFPRGPTYRDETELEPTGPTTT